MGHKAGSLKTAALASSLPTALRLSCSSMLAAFDSALGLLFTIQQPPSECCCSTPHHFFDLRRMLDSSSLLRLPRMCVPSCKDPTLYVDVCVHRRRGFGAN